jgi:DNA repair protein RecN (Recombination protein N)
MLQSLRIRNLVIIEDLSVDFAPGLNLLTGETGTGKSIVVDAVGLAIGRRADRSLIRAGADRAIVEALFQVGSDSAVARWAAERDMPDLIEDGQLVVRREVAATGGSVKLNGSPCTQSMLAEVGALLLELHGQHEFRTLLSPERHLSLLDRFGDLGERLEVVGDRYRAVNEARRKLEELRRAAEGRADNVARLEAALREIDAVGPRSGELGELERERELLRNSAEVSGLVEEIVELAYEGERTAASLASTAARSARRLAEIDPTMAEVAARLVASSLEIQEAGAAVRDYRDSNDFNPQRLEEVEARRAALERLLLRFGETEDDVLERRSEMQDELARVRELDGAVAEDERDLRRAEAEYVTEARLLGERRQRAARELAPAVEEQLSALALGKARFDVRLAAAVGERVQGEGDETVPLTVRGGERGEFQLAANPGEPSRPLNRVASGGELSRVMLALHGAVDGAGDDRTIVFDEVDAGIGGRVANAVGARLARLARGNQVLCVTHLPQVAAFADWHLAVRKQVRGGRTSTAIEALDGERRVEELARMLGGRKVTPTSRKHAAELLATTTGPARPARSRREA